MTVKELIKVLCDVDDLNAEIDVYVSATKGNLVTDDWNELNDRDYVLDDWCSIEEVEERESVLDGSVSYHIHIRDWG